jgi:hypothetical protein
MSAKNNYRIDLTRVGPKIRMLNEHPVYRYVTHIESLRVFMAHHIFSVWDFMCLLKTLQHQIAPSGNFWKPDVAPELRRFVNEIVLAEESDIAPKSYLRRSRTHVSHFELYCEAMREIGANPDRAQHFVQIAAKDGIRTALNSRLAPPGSVKFVQKTFGFIDSGKGHVIATAFAVGREHVIASMFSSLLKRMKIAEKQAPAFHYYLARHIDLDGNEHGPLALDLIDALIDSPQKLAEAQKTANDSIDARIRFWDDTKRAIEATKKAN